MEIANADKGHIYRITIKETLDAGGMDWFGDLTLTVASNGGTLITGSFPDQPALRGFLDQLWNLNLTVQSVDQGDHFGLKGN